MKGMKNTASEGSGLGNDTGFRHGPMEKSMEKSPGPTVNETVPKDDFNAMPLPGPFENPGDKSKRWT